VPVVGSHLRLQSGQSNRPKLARWRCCAVVDAVVRGPDDCQAKAVVGLEFEKVSQPAAYRGECCVIGAPGAARHSLP
jgi:hypothetical protein